MCCSRISSSALSLLFVLTGPVAAAVIEVPGPPGCMLGDAIEAANTDAAVGDCTAGSGADRLELGYGATLPSADTTRSTKVAGAYAGLPDVTSTIDLVGTGASSAIARTSAVCEFETTNDYRLLNVMPGAVLSLTGIHLLNGCVVADSAADEARGGAIYVLGGTLRLRQADVRDNKAFGYRPGTGNASSARGGAIAVQDGEFPLIEGIFFQANGAFAGHLGATPTEATGGAVWISGGTLERAADSVFHLNTAVGGNTNGGSARGGALHLENSDATVLDRLAFLNNRAEGGSSGGFAAGGAIARSGGVLAMLSESLFSGNIALGGEAVVATLIGGGAAGGAIFSTGVGLGTIERSSFVTNEALGRPGWLSGGDVSGGAIHNGSAATALLGNTFHDNAAYAGAGSTGIPSGPGGDAFGGAVRLAARFEMVASNSFGSNFAQSGTGSSTGAVGGGAIYGSPEPVATLRSNLLGQNGIQAGSGAPLASECDAAAPINSAGFNLVQFPGGCVFGADDTTGTNPLFALSDVDCVDPIPAPGPPGSSACLPVLQLDAGSPAVDRGVCGLLVADGRGHGRPQDIVELPSAPGGDGCDIGAFELDGEVDLVLTVSETADPIVVGPTFGNLTYVVDLTNNGTRTATGVVVGVEIPLVTGVTTLAVIPEAGTNWSSLTATWTLDLGAGENAQLIVVLNVSDAAPTGPDALTLDASLDTVVEGNRVALPILRSQSTTVLPLLIFADGFETGIVWSAQSP